MSDVCVFLPVKLLCGSVLGCLPSLLKVAVPPTLGAVRMGVRGGISTNYIEKWSGVKNGETLRLQKQSTQTVKYRSRVRPKLKGVNSPPVLNKVLNKLFRHMPRFRFCTQ